jgi:hypothetical protein
VVQKTLAIHLTKSYKEMLASERPYSPGPYRFRPSVPAGAPKIGREIIQEFDHVTGL